MGQTRLAEMDLGIDDTWENVQALAIDHGFRCCTRQVAQSGNPPVLYADICLMDSVMVDDSSAPKNRIKAIHVFLDPEFRQLSCRKNTDHAPQ